DFGEDGVRNSGSPQRSHEGQGDYGDRYSGREGGSNQFSSWRNDPSDTRSGSQQGMRGDSQRAQQSDQQQRGQHAGRGPKGYRRDDARITEDVNEALTHDHDIDASEIEVTVSGGEVTLSGTVDSREAKRHAEDIAERVSGVSDVNNQIRVARAGATGPSTSHKEAQHMGNKPANDKMSDPNAEKDHKPSTKDGAADGTSTADGAMSSQGSGPSGAANTSTPDKNPSVKNIPSTQGTSAHKTQGRGS
ncbi:MAG: BON domain-containing protein, partial [Phycisphaerae bacterium]|nr:BON domain-containing protein [Gemmatimonadaceae bacterium]